MTLRDRIEAHATSHGWTVIPTREARLAAGVPEPDFMGIVMFNLPTDRVGTILVVHAQEDGEVLTDRQQRWVDGLAGLEPAGVLVRVWREADWPEIERTLR